MIVLEVFLTGFITAFGWWSANYYIIDPHFPKTPPAIEKKVEPKVETTKEVEQEVKNEH